MAEGVARRMDTDPADRDPRLVNPDYRGISGDDVVRIGDTVLAGYFRRNATQVQSEVLAANSAEVRSWVAEDLADGRDLTSLMYDFGRSTIEMLLDDGVDPLSLLPLDTQTGTNT